MQSSDLQGHDVNTVVRLPHDSLPVGIGLLGSRIYWTNLRAKTLESSSKSGQYIQLLHNETSTDSASYLHRLAVVPRPDIPIRRRTNSCENQKCAKVCVLTPSSYSCLS